jgi:hypothetical protein
MRENPADDRAEQPNLHFPKTFIGLPSIHIDEDEAKLFHPYHPRSNNPLNIDNNNTSPYNTSSEGSNFDSRDFEGRISSLRMRILMLCQLTD